MSDDKILTIFEYLEKKNREKLLDKKSCTLENKIVLAKEDLGSGVKKRDNLKEYEK